MTTPRLEPIPREHFEIAIVCALRDEVNEVLDVLDNEYKNVGSAKGDNNSYTGGVIGEHNIIVVHMPQMGNVASASGAASILYSFPNIKLALIVGICGGVPRGTGRGDIYLGDLVISTAVVQYDFGRVEPSGFARKDSLEDNLGRPSPKIRGVLAKLSARRHLSRFRDDMADSLRMAVEKDPDIGYPGAESDYLFDADYIHQHKPDVCDDCAASRSCSIARKATCKDIGCDFENRVARHRATLTKSDQEISPAVHFGRIGSGTSVIRSGKLRDKSASRDDLIAYEMEGAGVWDHIPCVVIKAVCDYADSHKGRSWRLYAAAVAAAGAKAFLMLWPHSDPETPTILTPATSRTTTLGSEVADQPSVTFNNYGWVGSQLGSQTIHGNVRNDYRF